jgi:hypothetical protein
MRQAARSTAVPEEPEEDPAEADAELEEEEELATPASGLRNSPVWGLKQRRLNPSHT